MVHTATANEEAAMQGTEPFVTTERRRVPSESPEGQPWRAWRCANAGCRNRRHWIGYDDEGWGGPDECDTSCGWDPDAAESDPCPSCGKGQLVQAVAGDRDGAAVLECSNCARRTPTYCGCTTTLTQHLHLTGRIRPDTKPDADYEAFTGGGGDAEIGPYTRIACAACGTCLWADIEWEGLADG